MTTRTVPSMARRAKSAPRRTKQYPRLEGDAALRCILDAGLLFQFNRTIAHPLGLAAMVEEGDRGLKFVIVDRREAPETALFTEAELTAGLAKLKAYLGTR